MCKGAIALAKDAMLEGKKRAYEEISHILDGVLDGLGDDDISSKYNIDVKSVQQIRARISRQAH